MHRERHTEATPALALGIAPGLLATGEHKSKRLKKFLHLSHFCISTLTGIPLIILQNSHLLAFHKHWFHIKRFKMNKKKKKAKYGNLISKIFLKKKGETVRGRKRKSQKCYLRKSSSEIKDDDDNDCFYCYYSYCYYHHHHLFMCTI